MMESGELASERTCLSVCLPVILYFRLAVLEPGWDDAI